ncbi:hypothetical protein GOP47_0019899 [Adiantum capillus-veneris]|uniref:Uncharacterized protein n=1 Tax=Adiantum capillus-veneris TaxID=13818 RepID=A0A9D4UDC8_ADICA|nr:hypothetical protein GOP47_0019899 [Adiantum capillus-veneris]
MELIAPSPSESFESQQGLRTQSLDEIFRESCTLGYDQLDLPCVPRPPNGVNSWDCDAIVRVSIDAEIDLVVEFRHCCLRLPDQNMGKGPGLFSDIGKKAKDLLTKDYLEDHKITISTQSETGLAFTTSGVKKGDVFVGDVSTKLTKNNVTTDIKLDTNSNIFTTITIDEFASGCKSIINITIPDPNSGKLEVQYHHENAGLSCSSGLTAVPLVEVNGVFGNGRFAAGGEAAFDTNSGTFTKYNAGIGFNESDFTVALLLVDKGDTLKASYVHNAAKDKRTTVGAEIVHKLSKHENTFTFGNSFAWDPMTTVKARMNNHGTMAGLVQHEWRPKSTVTLSVTKPWEQPARYGLALALKP